MNEVRDVVTLAYEYQTCTPRRIRKDLGLLFRSTGIDARVSHFQRRLPAAPESSAANQQVLALFEKCRDWAGQVPR